MKNLFVGNLPFSATEADLKSLFEQFGAVDRVNVITDRMTGKPRGFAFVEMGDDEGAAKAISGLNGTEFGGRALRVSEANPREEGRSGGGGGEGRGRRPGGSDRGPSRPRREPRW